MGGLCLYPNDTDRFSELLGFLNSKVCEIELNVINPTMSFPPGTINSLAYKPIENGKEKEACRNIVDENVAISKSDWDSFETSWDFKRHPLV